MSSALTVKSTQEGLELWFASACGYEEARSALVKKLAANRPFYAGTSRPVLFLGKCFSALQKRELSQILHAEYGMLDVRFVDEEEHKNAAPPPEPVVNMPYDEAKSLFLRTTIRGGQRVECEGDLVIVGDVNSGAELIAGGNIAVFGKLRGLAHAGASGRTDVCIVATVLLPKQVRIAGKIAIIPESRRIEGAEIVTLCDDRIIVGQLA